MWDCETSDENKSNESLIKVNRFRPFVWMGYILVGLPFVVGGNGHLHFIHFTIIHSGIF